MENKKGNWRFLKLDVVKEQHELELSCHRRESKTSRNVYAPKSWREIQSARFVRRESARKKNNHPTIVKFVANMRENIKRMECSRNMGEMRENNVLRRILASSQETPRAIAQERLVDQLKKDVKLGFKMQPSEDLLQAFKQFGIMRHKSRVEMVLKDNKKELSRSHQLRLFPANSHIMNPGWRIWTMDPSLIIFQSLWFATKFHGFSNGYKTIHIYYFVGSILMYKICSNLSTNILPKKFPPKEKIHQQRKLNSHVQYNLCCSWQNNVAKTIFFISTFHTLVKELHVSLPFSFKFSSSSKAHIPSTSLSLWVNF